MYSIIAITKAHFSYFNAGDRITATTGNSIAVIAVRPQVLSAFFYFLSLAFSVRFLFTRASSLCLCDNFLDDHIIFVREELPIYLQHFLPSIPLGAVSTIALLYSCLSSVFLRVFQPFYSVTIWIARG